MTTTADPMRLATYRAWQSHARTAWPIFQTQRLERLAEGRRYGKAPEKVAENIVEDLLVDVLGWSLADINHQVERCDILVTHLGVRRLVVEAKRPELLRGPRQIEAAFHQARCYAETLGVDVVVVSDGGHVLARDLVPGDWRAEADLCAAELDDNLWWLSSDGIYRTPTPLAHPAAWTGQTRDAIEDPSTALEGLPRHPKYGLPALCFAYVGVAADPHTWKLPYLRADGQVDHSRLPKAIQCVLTNYRGEHISGIPETAIPAVLRRLADAAQREGRMPSQCLEPAPVYLELEYAVSQIAAD